MSVRLNVYIAQGSKYSRRKADGLIQSGVVTVNNAVMRLPYYQVQAADAVCVHGQKIVPEKRFYVLMNKPRGYTCTREDVHAERKVTDLLPAGLRELYPVGRLDKNSRGLLLLTNDGEFCFQVTHPRFEIEKEYRVVVSPAIKKADIDRLQGKKGLSIGGEWYSIRSVRVVSDDMAGSIVLLTCAEGKKRHVRLIFSAMGYSVRDLQRVRIGTLRVDGIPEGGYRHLHEKEKQSFQPVQSKRKE